MKSKVIARLLRLLTGLKIQPIRREPKTVAKLLKNKVNGIPLEKEYQNTQKRRINRNILCLQNFQREIVTSLTFSGVTLLSSK